MSDLTVSGYDAEEGYGDGEIYCGKLDTYGRTITRMYWYDIAQYEEDNEVYGPWYGWYDGDGEVEYNDMTLEAGEGLWFTSPNASFKINSSGQVASSATAIALSVGQQLLTNPNPVNITMGDIAVSGYDAEEGYGDGEIYCGKLDTYGRTITRMYWYDIAQYEEDNEVYGPWYGWYDGDGEVEYNDEPLAAGTGIWFTSPSASYTLTFPSPL